MRFLLFFLALINLTTTASAVERLYKNTNWISTDKVVLQGLDKVSARVFTSEIAVNQKVHFGSLEVYVRSANRSPPEEQPESICFVEIFDNKPGQQRQQVFSGWMFSSNPALSALEHPVYDIWIKDAIAPKESTDLPVSSGEPEQDKKKSGEPEPEEIEEDVIQDLKEDPTQFPSD